MPEPTQAFPGSAEKIAILAARLGSGLVLHHPQDNTSRRSDTFDNDFDKTDRPFLPQETPEQRI